MSLVEPQPKPVFASDIRLWDLVREDMKDRDRFGSQKYGMPLHPYNGRDALVDAYLGGYAVGRRELRRWGFKQLHLFD